MLARYSNRKQQLIIVFEETGPVAACINVLDFGFCFGFGLATKKGGGDEEALKAFVRYDRALAFLFPRLV